MPRLPKSRQVSQRRKQGRPKKFATVKNDHNLDDWFDFDQFMKGCLIETDDKSSILSQNLSELLEVNDSDGCSAHEFYVILDKPYQYCEHDNLDQFVINQNTCRYGALKEVCKQIDINEFSFLKSSSNITFIQVYDNEIPKIKVAVSILQNYEIHISVHGTRVSLSHEIWNELPQTCVTAASVEVILKKINQYRICSGNPDEHLQSLISNGADLTISEVPNFQGFRDTYTGVSTIRSTSCQLLVGNHRCKDCQRYRGSLRKMFCRKRKSTPIETPQKNWKSSRVNNKNLPEKQKMDKIMQLQTYASSLEKENVKLKKAIDRQIKESGVQNDQNEDFIQIMKEFENDALCEYTKPESYQRLFWAQQKKYLELNNKRTMRWHPVMIKWCIFLKSKSNSTYNALRKSGFINLPSERTLYDYTRVVEKDSSLRPDVVSVMQSELSSDKETNL